jgi:hypothetical protein
MTMYSCFMPALTGVIIDSKYSYISYNASHVSICSDFCILYKGVHLCYEGSPGWQAYGKDGFPRRARVTELRDFGRNVVTWKRLDTSIGEIQCIISDYRL